MRLDAHPPPPQARVGIERWTRVSPRACRTRARRSGRGDTADHLPSASFRLWGYAGCDQICAACDLAQNRQLHDSRGLCVGGSVKYTTPDACNHLRMASRRAKFVSARETIGKYKMRYASVSGNRALRGRRCALAWAKSDKYKTGSACCGPEAGSFRAKTVAQTVSAGRSKRADAWSDVEIAAIGVDDEKSLLRDACKRRPRGIYKRIQAWIVAKWSRDARRSGRALRQTKNAGLGTLLIE